MSIIDETLDKLSTVEGFNGKEKIKQICDINNKQIPFNRDLIDAILILMTWY